MANEIGLAEYLMAPEKEAVVTAPVAEVEAVAPSDALPVEVEILAVPATPDAEIRQLMSCMKRIGMCAKNLHYRAKGKPFYGLHLLADLIYQVEHDTDDLAEVYFLGERGIEPPLMEEVCGAAANLAVHGENGDKHYVSCLLNICFTTMKMVEDIKQKYPDIKSGVVAVLDHISQMCLLNIGLLDQTMKG